MAKDYTTPFAASLALLLASAGVSANTSTDGQEASSLKTAAGVEVQISTTPTPAVDEFILLDGFETDFEAKHASHSSHSSHSSHASHASGL